MSPDPESTLREARDAYFADNGLPPGGGYDEDWVKTKVGPFPFAYPNTAGRKQVVAQHDLHHVITGYSTALVGEAQVGAWELGTGMRHAIGVYLSLLVIGFVVVWAPRPLLEAFARGRRSRNLLDRDCDDALLSRRVAEVCEELGLTQAEPSPTPADRRAFIGWSALGVAIVWGPLVPMAALAWWWWG